MSYSSVVLADSPIAYYRLDGTAGRTLDSSGNARTLTASGSNFTDRASLILSDTANGSCEFDNQTATGVLTSSDATFDRTGTNAYTVEFWCKLTTIDTTYRRLIGWSDDGGASPNYYGVQVQSAAGFYAVRMNAGSVTGPNGTPSVFDTSTYYHVVHTYDGSNIRLYVNTVQMGSTTADSSSLGAFGGDFQIGAGQFGSSSAKAWIDEVAVYTTALNTTQIAAHYNAATQLTNPTIRTVATGLRW